MVASSEALSVTVLNTGESWQVTREAFTDAQIDELTYLSTAGGSLPAPHGDHSVKVTHFVAGEDCVHFVLRCGETLLLCASLVWGNAEKNWGAIERTYLTTCEALPDDFKDSALPVQPEEVPWLAILRTPTGNKLSPAALCWLEQVILPNLAFSFLAELDRQILERQNFRPAE